MVDSPLRRYPEAATWEHSLSFAGYEQATTLQLFSPPEGVRLCLWSLTVLPGGGDLVVPTLHTTKTRDFMEPTGQSHLSSDEDAVRFRLDGLERHKVGIKPEPLTGRMGYVRAVGEDQWTLMVRNFAVDPSAEYVDVPWDDPQDLGYAVEIYNDGEDGFGEMEYHSPAVSGDPGMDVYVDHSQLWSFRGPPDVIEIVGYRLLGVEVSTRPWPR
jgi:hypothetical protein